jgi:2-methylisocitrate lyase-like PEP mutase family enzyme
MRGASCCNRRMTSDFARRARLFRELHDSPDLLVLPNPWDAGSARLLENLGYKALATTSAGLAFSLGRRDGEAAVTADETFDHVRALLAATKLPISADLENGFGASPEIVAATIRRAGEVGLSGASIEDASYDAGQPLYDRALATERIVAAVEAARALPYPFVLTARAENFIRCRADLDDVLARLHAYDTAGADVLYAPGLPDADAIRRVCRSTTKPVNVVAGIGPTRLPLSELAALGVRRVSIGTSFARAALNALLRAGKEVLERGTFDYLDGVPSVADFNRLIAP